MKENLPSIFSKFTEDFLLRYIGKWNVSDDKDIITSITINAGKEQVWEILTSYREYSTWNPFIIQIAGKLNTEDFTKVIVQVPQVPEDFFYYAFIKKEEAYQKLVWKSRLYVDELFSGRHIFTITEQAENKVLFTHQGKYSGLLVFLIDPAFFGKVKRGMNSMNNALKKRAENLYNKYVLSEN